MAFSSSWTRLGETPYNEINNERIRAHNKHKKGGASMEEASWNDPAWLPVLVEEVGEVAEAFCERRHGNLSHEEFIKELRKELIQVAAMAMAWVDSIDASVDHEGH